jgi:(p)ppGpp synthase/HD superfamily hydrolase
MIHSADCRNLERVNPQRMLSAYWQVGDKWKILSFIFLFHDSKWLLARFTKICYNMQINIVDMSVETNTNWTCSIHLAWEVSDEDTSFSQRFLDRIRQNMPEFLMQDDDCFDKRK